MRRTTIPLLLLALSAPAEGAGEFLRLPGEKNGDEHGASVQSAGDVDGDGIPDVAVGAPRYDSSATLWAEEGKVEVHSGRDGTLLHRFLGTADHGHLGWAVAGIGDVNQDGHDDVAVGLPDAQTAFFKGGVQVRSGKDGAVLYSILTTYLYPDDARLGASLTALSDVDGDGVPDFAAGAPGADVSSVLGTIQDAGQAIVFSGIDGHEIRRFSGAQVDGAFGASVANAGDVDLDGRDDLVIGEPGANLSSALPTVDCGRVVVTSIVPGVTLRSTYGGLLQHGIRFGTSVAGVGDVDGDGVPDHAGGAPYADGNGTDAGFVRVHSGSTGATIWVLHGTLAGERFGGALSGIGDQDGDGRPDVLCGAPNSSLGSPFGVPQAGRVRICAGPTGATIDALSTVDPFARFGDSVADAGDLDGDGRSDFVAGAVGGNGDQPQSGYASIFLTGDCTAQAYNYGVPLAGTLGVPALTLDDPPRLCASNVLTLGNSSGSPTGGTLFVGIQEANLPTAFGASLLLHPLVSVNVALPPGGVALPVEHPCDATLCGTKVFLQLLVADPGAPAGVAFSHGLYVLLGI